MAESVGSVARMSGRTNLVVQLVIGLGTAFIALVVPIPVVVALFFANAHLGLGGYLVVGVAVFFLIFFAGVGSMLLAGWLVDRRTPEGRRPWAILIGIIALLQLASIVAIVVVSVRAGASAGVPISLILPAILLTLGLLWLGERLGRQDAERAAAAPPPTAAGSEWKPVRPRALRRAAWIIGSTFAAVAIPGLAVVFIVSINIDVVGADPGRGADLFESLSLLALSFAFLAAGIAASVLSLPIAARIKPLFRGSYVTQKAVFGVVLRGRVDDLDPDGRLIAARYASLMSDSLPLSLVSVLTSFAGISLIQVSTALETRQSYPLGPALILICALLLTAIFAVPYIVSRTRRARRYALANAALLAPAS